MLKELSCEGNGDGLGSLTAQTLHVLTLCALQTRVTQKGVVYSIEGTLHFRHFLDRSSYESLLFSSRVVRSTAMLRGGCGAPVQQVFMTAVFLALVLSTCCCSEWGHCSSYPPLSTSPCFTVSWVSLASSFGLLSCGCSHCLRMIAWWALLSLKRRAQ